MKQYKCDKCRCLLKEIHQQIKVMIGSNTKLFDLCERCSKEWFGEVGYDIRNNSFVGILTKKDIEELKQEHK